MFCSSLAGGFEVLAFKFFFSFKVEKMQSKLKMNKRFIDENEEEITQLKNKTRKIQRDLEEANEQNEILNQNLAALRTKQR